MVVDALLNRYLRTSSIIFTAWEAQLKVSSVELIVVICEQSCFSNFVAVSNEPVIFYFRRLAESSLKSGGHLNFVLRKKTGSSLFSVD